MRRPLSREIVRRRQQMYEIHEATREHLTAAERACVLRYVDLLRGELGDRLVEVYLFGSFARGDAWRPSSPMRSDIDLLVVCSEPPPESKVEDLINRARCSTDARYSDFIREQIRKAKGIMEECEKIVLDVPKSVMDMPGRARQILSAKMKLGRALTDAEVLSFVLNYLYDRNDGDREDGDRPKPGTRRKGDTTGDPGRTIPAEVLRNVNARGRRCQFPDCGIAVFLQYCHREAHVDGGSREAANILHLCY